METEPVEKVTCLFRGPAVLERVAVCHANMRAAVKAGTFPPPVALSDQAEVLVPRWLPHGTRLGHRWHVGDFDGAEGKRANVNLQTGLWFDNAGGDQDKDGDLASLYARIRGLNVGQAAPELMRMLGCAIHGVPAGLARVQACALAILPRLQKAAPAPTDAPASAPVPRPRGHLGACAAVIKQNV